MLPTLASSSRDFAGRGRFQASGAGGSLSSARKRLRILVADDEHDTVLTMMTILRDEGHEVRGVHDGEAAIRVTREFEPDAILLDIGMPKLSGYDVARALRAAYGENCPTLIAVTAYARTLDKLAGQIAGFDHHFGKPIVIDELVKVLSEIKPK